MNKIPDRWLEYTAMGTKVAGTRFIAFKTPLKKEICSKMKPQDRFTPEILMERCPNMRLIIDLTNTSRYYNKQEFIDRGIQYEKIMCPGQVIPPQSLIFRFFEVIDDFYLKNGFKDVLIGIHCTHGVNRTGYFIGRYMVQRMGFRFDKAIFCIEEARGHKIERLNYVKDLNCQDPIPSSLSSSGKKFIDPTKPEQKNGTNVGSGKAGGKITRQRTPEKSHRKPSDMHEFPSKSQRVRTPDQSYKPKDISGRSGNFSSSSGRLYSPIRRGTPPVKRTSPNRRGFSPGRRSSPVGRGVSGHPGGGRGPRGFSPGGRVPSGRAPRGPSPVGRAPRGPSPVGRTPRGSSPGGRPPPRSSTPFGRVPRGPSPIGRGPRGPSPKRFRSSPSWNMPRPLERQRSPPRRPSPRRFSPKKETDFVPPPFRAGDREDRDISRGSVPYRSYSPPARSPSGSNFSREQSDIPRIYSQSSDSQWRPSYEKGFDVSSGPTSGYAHAPNQYTVSRTSDRNWESWSHDRSNSNASRPHSSSTSSQQWNHPTTTFSAPPPPNLNVPPPGYDSRSGRFLERRFDGSSQRDDGRKQWINERSSELSVSSSSGYQETKGFLERNNDYRSRPQEKYEKPYRSPSRDFNREKRQHSPSRDYSRNYDSGIGRDETTWTHQKPPLEPTAFGEYRSGSSKKSRSPVRRTSPLPPPVRKSRSPRRRSPGPRNVGVSYDQRRSPPRTRAGEQPVFHPSHFNAPPPPNPSQAPYQDKRYFESNDDCRDILNQKRHFDSGEQRDYYSEPKTKLDVRVVPKEVDLRNVISRSGHQEPLLKERLGPPPRDDPAQDFSRRYGVRGRSRSPRPRSPPHYGVQSHRRY